MKLALVAMAPPAAMIDALCDRTCDLAGALAHVQSARIVNRSIGADGLVVGVQRWRARASVPALLRPHLEESLLDWTLTFERRLGALDCTWHAESAARQLAGRLPRVSRGAAGDRRPGEPHRSPLRVRDDERRTADDLRAAARAALAQPRRRGGAPRRVFAEGVNQPAA